MLKLAKIGGVTNILKLQQVSEAFDKSLRGILASRSHDVLAQCNIIIDLQLYTLTISLVRAAIKSMLV